MIFTNTLTKRKKQKLLYKERLNNTNNDVSKNSINNIINNNQIMTNSNAIKMLLDDETNKATMNTTNTSINTFKLNQNVTSNLHNIKYSEPDLNPTNTDVSLAVNTNISALLEKSNTLNNVKEEPQILEHVKKQVDYEKLNYVIQNVKLIVNVYQEKYADNKKASGFGDFIRGSYYLIQFCGKHKIKYNIDISNHPLSNCLKNKMIQTNNNNNIVPFSKNNFIPEILDDNTLSSKRDDETEAYFIDYLYQQYTNNSNSKNNTTLLVYVIAFPDQIVNNNDKQVMRYILEPSDIIKQKVLTIVNNLSFKYRQFNIIHIRCGDNLLVNKESKFDLECINNIFDELDDLFVSVSVSDSISNSNNNYLLLADNNYIKQIILNKYTNNTSNTSNKLTIKTLYNEITHLGEGVKLTNNAIENTMLEFYLISLANKVFSLSVYKHGSGFSKWCAETYNIQYTSKYIGIE